VELAAVVVVVVVADAGVRIVRCVQTPTQALLPQVFGPGERENAVLFCGGRVVDGVVYRTFVRQ
jgi:hypothetical protein